LNSAFDVIKNAARGVGIAVSRYPPPDSFRRTLRDFLSQMNVNVVLDIGAFVGGYGRELREIGYRGHIISFEPVPASYGRLKAEVGNDPLWSCQAFGLSEENREAALNTYSNADFNSLLNLRHGAEQAYSLKTALRSQLTIQLRRLDTVLPALIQEIPSPRIFMKMDTQGHDVSVVKGASGILDKIIGLQSELPAVELYDGMTSMHAALAFYADSGFVPISFFPVNTFRATQISPEFDVLLKRFNGRL
jgi:FkbM family methyltransferase